jgi:hypothetical protein
MGMNRASVLADVIYTSDPTSSVSVVRTHPIPPPVYRLLLLDAQSHLQFIGYSSWTPNPTSSLSVTPPRRPIPPPVYRLLLLDTQSHLQYMGCS